MRILSSATRPISGGSIRHAMAEIARSWSRERPTSCRSRWPTTGLHGKAGTVFAREGMTSSPGGRRLESPRRIRRRRHTFRLLRARRPTATSGAPRKGCRGDALHGGQRRDQRGRADHQDHQRHADRAAGELRRPRPGALPDQPALHRCRGRVAPHGRNAGGAPARVPRGERGRGPGPARGRVAAPGGRHAPPGGPQRRAPVPPRRGPRGARAGNVARPPALAATA